MSVFASILFIILGLFVAAAAFAFLFRIFNHHARMIREELDRMALRVNAHLQQTAELTQKTGEGTVRAISDLYTRLGGLEESSRKIFDLGKEIGKLQDVLCAPKARGGLGELILSDLLSQIIPQDHYQMQYTFRSGSRVDAIIFVGDYLVPIDAKFPLPNFERLQNADADDDRKRIRKEFARDIKKHIQDIAARYILPEEGTLDFALMYVPAENVYYEIITMLPEADETSLSNFALKHRVIPVSPNSFYAYLQIILMGLRGLRMDQAAREIAETMMKLRSDFERLISEFSTLGAHLNHAQGSFDRIQKNLDRFHGKFMSLDQAKLISPEDSEKPVELEKLPR